MNKWWNVLNFVNKIWRIAADSGAKLQRLETRERRPKPGVFLSCRHCMHFTYFFHYLFWAKKFATLARKQRSTSEVKYTRYEALLCTIERIYISERRGTLASSQSNWFVARAATAIFFLARNFFLSLFLQFHLLCFIPGTFTFRLHVEWVQRSACNKLVLTHKFWTILHHWSWLSSQVTWSKLSLISRIPWCSREALLRGNVGGTTQQNFRAEKSAFSLSDAKGPKNTAFQEYLRVP